mgnify:CR=1 FL=1
MCSRTPWPTLFWAPAAGETSASYSPTPILPTRVLIQWCCSQPKITPHRDAMRANLAHALGVDVENVGVAATTTEKLGWEGQGEGIGAWAVCLLQKTVKE